MEYGILQAFFILQLIWPFRSIVSRIGQKWSSGNSNGLDQSVTPQIWPERPHSPKFCWSGPDPHTISADPHHWIFIKTFWGKLVAYKHFIAVLSYKKWIRRKIFKSSWPMSYKRLQMPVSGEARQKTRTNQCVQQIIPTKNNGCLYCGCAFWKCGSDF